MNPHRISNPRRHFSRTVATGLTGLLLATGVAGAAEIKVMISAGFSEAYYHLLPAFEQRTGHKIETIRGPSMGDRPQAVPNRIARYEPVDVVIINAAMRPPIA